MDERNWNGKVGDWVEFKRDIEGHGTILEVWEEKMMFGTQTNYIVGYEGGSHERWHIACQSHPKHGAVVYLTDYEIYHIDRK